MTEQTQYDPADHTVDEVLEHLGTLDPEGDEHARILQAERDGKARVGIVGSTEPTPEAPGALTTKGQTFSEAAEHVEAPTAPIGRFITSTDALKAEGKSKGLTFAEQAKQAQALYGTGR